MQLMSTTLLKHRFTGLQPDQNCIAAADCCLGADAASIGAGAVSDNEMQQMLDIESALLEAALSTSSVQPSVKHSVQHPAGC